MELLTIDECAGLLKLKPASVYEMTRKRSQERQAHPIPFIRIAGQLRFNKAAIERWLLEMESAA